jgi:hypothetical protein
LAAADALVLKLFTRLSRLTTYLLYSERCAHNVSQTTAKSSKMKQDNSSRDR